jgi:hypothetical protein
MSRRLGMPETERLVREALERQFPGVEFHTEPWVRPHDGAPLLLVAWRRTDAPLLVRVMKVTELFAGRPLVEADELDTLPDEVLAKFTTQDLARLMSDEVVAYDRTAMVWTGEGIEEVQYGADSVVCFELDPPETGGVPRSLEDDFRMYFADYIESTSVPLEDIELLPPDDEDDDAGEEWKELGS